MANRISDRRGGGFNVALDAPDGTWHQLAERGLKEPGWDETHGYWYFGEELDDLKALAYLQETLHFMVLPTARILLKRLTEKHRDDLSKDGVIDLARKLRAYQLEGVSFIRERQRTLLADSMGLGKTLQALMAVEQEKAFPCVVICPASVKASWVKEIQKWLPWRTFQVLMSSRDEVIQKDFTILNPESLNKERVDSLSSRTRKSIIFDESHYFKNPESQRSRNAATLALNVPLRIALTGTPIKNTREDLVMQLRVLNQLENVVQIYRALLPRNFRIDPGSLGWEAGVAILNALPPTMLNARLRETCMIRRTKEDVGDMLPPLTRSIVGEDLSDETTYRLRERELVNWVRDWSFRSTDQKLAPADFVACRQRISALRQEAAIGKVPAAVEWAEDLLGSGERVIIFAYHKRVVHQLAAALPGRRAIITGDVPVEDRKPIIDGLGSLDFLVATMDSTGYGVDGMQLHASHVAFIELDWTPTKHEQCEGRVHRIGQVKDRVNAWYFVAQKTIDVEMMRRLDSKWRDIRGVVDGVASDGDAQFITGVVQRIVASKAWERPDLNIWAETASEGAPTLELPSP